MQGFVGEPKDLPWTSTSPAYEPAKNNIYTYDLDKAKSLVQQSGVTNPEFDINWALAGFSAEYQALATVIQADLAKIGIKTNLKPQDPPTFTAQGLGRTAVQRHAAERGRVRRSCTRRRREFALSRTMGYASNLAGFYDDSFKTLVTTAATEPDAGQAQADLLADQRLPAGRGVHPGDQRLLEHHGAGRQRARTAVRAQHVRHGPGDVAGALA